jgi:L-iditol 2-dehydrogenase
MGADMVVDPSQEDARERITGFFGGVGADVVLECAGAESAVNLAIELVRTGGRIALVGMSHDPVCINTLKMVLKGVQTNSVRDGDYTGAMALLEAKKVDCAEFLSGVVPLERVPATFEALLQPGDRLKIIVKH